MSSYLVALVVSDFERRSLDDSSTPRASALVQASATHQLQCYLQFLRPIVREFEKKLNHSYSLPKLDMAAVPDFLAGAMENWGLMVFRDTAALCPTGEASSVTSVAVEQAIYRVVAHEVTHQWFGNLVSPLWWKYTWLSEGFARYFQVHMLTEVRSVVCDLIFIHSTVCTQFFIQNSTTIDLRMWLRGNCLNNS